MAGPATKAGQAVLEQVGQRLWGFKPNLMADIVEQHGPATSLGWFARNMPGYEKILKDWGPIRTHLVATVASTLTGCRYCTFGHGYALELHYFKIHDRLMSVDEREIEDWCDVQDGDVVVAGFRRMLIDSDLESELPILDRLVELRAGGHPTQSADDQHATHLLKMFEFLNSCGIRAATDTDEAHDPINKDAELRREYASRRA